jgi:hypothetical protein
LPLPLVIHGRRWQVSFSSSPASFFDRLFFLSGFFKGTSADQDRRFSDKELKLLKSIKFPTQFDTKVYSSLSLSSFPLLV